jgi:hypothetical protein
VRLMGESPRLTAPQPDPRGLVGQAVTEVRRLGSAAERQADVPSSTDRRHRCSTAAAVSTDMHCGCRADVSRPRSAAADIEARLKPPYVVLNKVDLSAEGARSFASCVNRSGRSSLRCRSTSPGRHRQGVCRRGRRPSDRKLSWLEGGAGGLAGDRERTGLVGAARGEA